MPAGDSRRSDVTHSRRGASDAVEAWTTALLTYDVAEARRKTLALLSSEVARGEMWAVLDGNSLLPWARSRLAALGIAVPDELERLARARQADYRELARMTDRVLMATLMSFTYADIPVIPVKGSDMARRLHGDASLRVSGDLDILIRRADLERALTTLNSLGWTQVRRTQNGFEHPLHVRASNPNGLLPIEVHWRIHWHEDRFSEDVVARGVNRSIAARPAATDELLILLMVFARDGCVTVRLLADLHAWYRSNGDDRGTTVHRAGMEYPELRRLLTCTERIVRRRLSMPSAPAPRVDWAQRASMAIALAPPSRSVEQRNADATTIDVVMAARGRRLRVAYLAWSLGRSELPRAELGLSRGQSVVHAAKMVARGSWTLLRAVGVRPVRSRPG